MEFYSQLRSLVSPSEYSDILKVQSLMIVMGMLDLIGVASILPFMGVASNPEIITTNIYLSNLYKFLDLSSELSFIVLLGVINIILLFSSLGFRTYFVKKQLSLVYGIEHSLGCKLFRMYVQSPYLSIISNDQSGFGKNILSEVHQATRSGLFPILVIVAQSFSVLVLGAFLIWLSSSIMLAVIFFFLIAYFTVWMLVRKKSNTLGSLRLNVNSRRFSLINATFQGFKEVKFYSLGQKIYTEFFQNSKNYSDIQEQLELVSQIPRFVIEGLAFGGVMVIFMVQLVSGTPLSQIIPLVAVFTLAGYKIMPALQQIYQAVVTYSWGKASVGLVVKELIALGFDNGQSVSADNSEWRPARLEYFSARDKERLVVSDLTYKYPRAARNAINGVNFDFEFGRMYAIVGPSGCGKSTFADLLTGLMLPDSGCIRLYCKDDHISTESWRSLGSVSQETHLFDASLEDNIVVAGAGRLARTDAVWKALKFAGLEKFVLSDLGGDLGSNIWSETRLSGGQKQRVGIARALYDDPAILLFDEATSALDVESERDIMLELKRMAASSNVIIFITHRIHHLEQFDEILYFEDGSLKSSGSYEDLLGRDNNFKKFVKG